MGRLTIVLLLCWAILVAGTEDSRGKGNSGKGAHPAVTNDPIGATWAMGAGQAGIRLAADGDIRAGSATRMHHAGTVVASQGDALSTFRLGSGMGMGRRFLGEKARAPHNPELFSQLATDSAHGRIQDAVNGLFGAYVSPVEARPRALPAPALTPATLHGHLTAEHSTVGDNYDVWKMASGLDKRRLGEEAAESEAAEKVSPDNMQLLASMQAQAAVGESAGGGMSARYATKVGRETGLYGAVDRHMDTAFHVAGGEYPEGPIVRGDLVGWDGMPTRGYTDNGLKR
ncbi:hypothetical protein Rsub_03741 [Raphidocelis subcapitata]|uniref:Uncharacterized protein n=1 Tax=Raphidocelis subcapitata TaxID=307507 RepID=A0A2V0NTC9_9CHLO|nr:hypothetical protein Rsub_03741 [Raphidocelis subcapitata]|eukprot:GBF90886.1 hypothetical protein Rsub_03741 [Raphidocelis subcapitata]